MLDFPLSIGRVANMSKPEKRRLMMMGSGGSGGVTDETCGTFVFEGESHTLGELRIQSGSGPVSSLSLFSLLVDWYIFHILSPS